MKTNERQWEEPKGSIFESRLWLTYLRGETTANLWTRLLMSSQINSLVFSVSPPQWPLLTERFRRSKWMVCTDAPSLPSTCDRKQTMHPTWTICILFHISVFGTRSHFVISLCSSCGLSYFRSSSPHAFILFIAFAEYHWAIPSDCPAFPGTRHSVVCLIATQKKQIHISAKIFARALLMMLVTAWVIDATQGCTYGCAQGSTQGASHWRKRLRKSTEESD